MGRRTRFQLLLSLLVVFALFIAACGSEGESNDEADAEGGNDQVTFLLAYVHDMINAQYYLAESLGYFDQCGIDINFMSAAEVENPSQLLLTGEVDFAVIDPLFYMGGLANGLPVIAIAEDVASTGVTYASFKETGIEGPEDLPGHTVGIQPGGDSQWYLEAIMEQTLTPEEIEQVKTVPVGFSIAPLLSGKVDAYSLWPTNSDINTLIEEGREFNLIRASDYDIAVPGNVIVTSKKLLEGNPDLAARWLAAVSQGQIESLKPENRERAIEEASKWIGDTAVPEVLGRAYDVLRSLKEDPLWTSQGAGWNNPDGYADTQQFLLDNGQMEEALPVDSLYTDEVLEQVFNDDGTVDLEGVCGA